MGGGRCKGSSEICEIMRQTFRNRFRDDSIITIVINVSPCVFITAASNHVHFGSFPHSWFLFQLFDWLYIFEDTLSDSGERGRDRFTSHVESA